MVASGLIRPLLGTAWLVCLHTVMLTSTHALSLNAPAVHKSVSIGGSKVLDCDISYPLGQEQVEHIMTWRNQDAEVPIFIQFNGYPPHIDEKFQGRIRLVEQGSIEISDVRIQDEGWYQCFIVFLNGSDEPGYNGTRIFLSVSAPPVLGEVSPSFLIQKVGETVDIFCEATGTPVPVLSWHKDGREIVPTDRITLIGSRVQVRRLVRTDAGVYACTFKNIVGQISHVIKLVIEGNAYIMIPPKNTTAKEGSRVKLNCQAEGSPNNITYHWFHNGDNVQRSVGLMTRASIYADGSFVINNVIKDDTGWYKCQPTNGLGSPPEAKAFLTITYMPRVLNMPTRVYLPRGMLGKIECTVDANPPVTLIIWTKNDRILDVSPTNRVRTNKQGVLIINPVTLADEGRYCCTPYSPLGAGQVSMPVQVFVKDPPHFLLRPNLIYQKLPGETVVIYCMAEGDPMPSLSWKKADGPFPPSTKTLLDGGNLTIVNLEKADHGTYECIATNVVTSVIATTLLIIEHTTPHEPYNLSVETTQSTATLMWLPSYDGGYPQHYVLWYRMQGRGSQTAWETIHILPDDATSITVYDLIPLTFYQFMVLSRNRLGDGLYSKPVIASTQGREPADGAQPTSGKSTKSWVQSTASTRHPPNILHPSSSRPGQEDSGLRPPTGITIYQSRGGLNISWQRPAISPLTPPMFYYLIEYRTVGQWVPLVHNIPANDTSYLWTTSSRGAIYNFRMFSYCQDAYSNSSQIVTVNTGTGDHFSNRSTVSSSLVGSLVGLVIFLIIAVIIAVASYKYFIKKKRREKSARYGNIKYFGPNQVEGNHNAISMPEALGQTCDNVDLEITPVAENRTTAGTEYFEKAMKETPI